MHKRKIIIISLIAVLALTLATVSGCAIGLKNPWNRPATTQINLPSDFKILEETWQVLSRDYVNNGDLDSKKLSQGAVKGMISALNDPYTAYLDGDLSGAERSMITGAYGGIGAVVGALQEQIVVVEIFPDSPASLAGIKAGDSIVEINGESTSGLTVNDAVSRIRGEKGSKVSLKIVRHGESTPQEIELVRGDIKMSTVTSKMLPDGIAYIRIGHFSEGTAADLESALREAQGQGIKAIVLDLRGNPGGLLESAIDVTSQFLKDGAVVWEGLGGDQWREWKVRDGGLATEPPMAVLVNADSASGSEVVAGALQDHRRAILIGEKTFGKGSVNLMRELSDGSSIYVTHARWLTPDRKLIEGKGITPDRVVAQTPEQRLEGIDPQLDAAIDYLKTATAMAQPTPA